MNNYIIRQENKNYFRAVEELTRRAFWNVYRPGCLEHYLLSTLRSEKDFVPELSLVMEKGGRIIGHIAFVKTHMTTSDKKELPVMTFGPLSIEPEFQRRGYGSALLCFAMEKAKALGCGALMTEGKFGFYSNCGFVLGKDIGIYYQPDKDADYFIVAELQPGFLSGVCGTYNDPPCYIVDEKQAELFDMSFPPMKKLRLPGQLV